MATFQNTKKLWKYIQDRESDKEITKDLDSTYKESFIKDLERSNGELHINGVSMDSILKSARESIEFRDKDTQQEIPIEFAARLIFEALFRKQPNKSTAADMQSSQVIDSIFDVLVSKQPISKPAIEELDPALTTDEFFEELTRKPTKQMLQETSFEKFLRTYLHQGFIYPNVEILSKGRYIFSTPEKRTLNLTYADESLFIQVDFSTQKVCDTSINEILEKTGDDFFVKGAATYKVNIKPINKAGWIAQFDLVDSKLECKDEYKDILDERTVFEKMTEFLQIILDKLKSYFSSKNALNSKHGSFFFISEDGTSVSEQILDDNTEPLSNIIKIAVDGMTQK
ncbi:hypothetical protein [Rickettsiella endosymbiont of Aleochara curtula]|uniref:hypothetical protein n=1 Tax=Rickettsiella endosymbiont of Aleochara curtula TaxID=3077936 RepID=UPI00313AE315